MRLRPCYAVGLASACLVLTPGQARGEPLSFNFISEPFFGGAQFTGTFSYDPASVYNVGPTEYFPTANSTITVNDGHGFHLTRPVAFVSVQPGDTTDYFYLQTFLSEHPNDWHISLEINTPGGPAGWLQGDSSLPAAFPADPDVALFRVYFTDEFEPVISYETTLISITAVPTPASLALLAPAATLLTTRRRRR